MIMWIIGTFPFKDKLICFSHIFSECGFLIYISSLFPFISDTMETSQRLYLGTIIIWGVFVLIVVIWFIFIVYLVKLLVLKRRERILKELEEERLKEKERRETKLRKQEALRDKYFGKMNTKITNSQRRDKVDIYIYIIYIYIYIHIYRYDQ